MLNKLRLHSWLYLVLVIVLACMIVPVAVSIGSEDVDCCTASECIDSFCVCHSCVVELPRPSEFIASRNLVFILSTDVFQYSLLVVSNIFRPPAV